MSPLKTILRCTALVGAVAWVAGCAHDTIGLKGVPAPLPPPFSVVISAPVIASGATARLGPAASNASAGPGVAYVSLLPGTVPGGATATIRNVANGLSVPAVVQGGGFDPVPIAASVGDSISVAVLDAAGAIVEVRAVVPPSTPPIVIRTVPPKDGTDVPLNSIIAIVFSAPIDPGSLNPATVRLRAHGAVIAGIVGLGAEPWLAELVPAEPLAPGTEYQLEIAESVRALDGTPLGSPLTVGFATAAAAPTETGYLVFGTDMGAQHQNIGVYWGARVESDPALGDWVRGESVIDATIAANGEAIPYRPPGLPFCCTGDDGTAQGMGNGLYQGRLRARVPDGDTLELDVSVGGVHLRGTGTVPEGPILTAPNSGSVFAPADSVTISWTSATNPDRFNVEATWVVGQSGYGRPFAAPGGARQLTIPAGSLPLNVQVTIRVFSYNDGSFVGPVSPQSRMSIRGERPSSAVITVMP